MKLYGSPICSQCVYSKKILDEKQVQYQYVNITESVSKMREFLALRDSRAEFEDVKKLGIIGIPAFLFNDGRIEFDLNDIYLEEIDEETEINDENPGLCGLDGC